MVKVSTLVLFLVAAWLALAAQALAEGQKISRKFDLNGDGAIDFDEFQKVLGATFDRLDRDHNGKLSRAELTGKSKDKDSMALWLTEARMNSLDKNEDAVWSREELLSPEAMRKLFIDLDINGDRRITADELSAGWLGGQTLFDDAAP